MRYTYVRGLVVATTLGVLLGGVAPFARPSAVAAGQDLDPATSTALALRGTGSPGGLPSTVALSGQELTSRPSGGGLALEGVALAADLFVQPADGERLALGTFPAATVGPSSQWAPGTVHVSADVGGHSCIVTAGAAVHVLDVAYAADGTVSRLAVDVTAPCAGYSDPQELRLRYRSAVPFVGISAPLSLDLGLVPLAYPVERDVTVRVVGTTPVTFGPARTVLASDAPGRSSDIVVKSDSCRGTTLGAGQSCTVRITAAPTAREHLVALLEIADDTTSGRTVLSTIHLDGWPRATGTFHPLAFRAHDSRTSPTRQPAAAGSTTKVPTAALVPGGGRTSAVVATLTATGAQAPGFVTAFDGSARPGTSSLNIAVGETRANLVTIVLTGTEPDLRLYTSTTTHLVLDIVGYYVANDSGAHGSQFDTLAPRRILDTRSSAPLPPGGSATIGLDFGAAFTDDVTAVAVNLTAVASNHAGYLQAWDGTTPATETSALNFGPGTTVAGAAVVAVAGHLGSGPTLRIRNGSAGATHVLVDVIGVYYADHAAGLRYTPVSPTRMIDTRKRLGSGPLGPEVTTSYGVPLTILPAGSEALVGNLTAVAPTESTYVTAWRSETGFSRPGTSSLNASARQVVANALVVELGTGSSGSSRRHFSVFNRAGSTHLVLDVSGAFVAYPPSSSGGTRTSFERPTVKGVTVTRG